VAEKTTNGSITEGLDCPQPGFSTGVDVLAQ